MTPMSDPRTPAQRKNRKRKDTHQIHDGAAREIAIEFPRFTRSSEQSANRAGVMRAAVVDIKLREVEQRLIALEARILRLAA